MIRYHHQVTIHPLSHVTHFDRAGYGINQGGLSGVGVRRVRKHVPKHVVKTGLEPCMNNCVNNCVTNGVKNGVNNCVKNGVTHGVKSGVKSGVTNGVKNGVTNEKTNSFVPLIQCFQMRGQCAISHFLRRYNA